MSTRISDLALKEVRYAPNGTNPLLLPSQNVLKSDLKKPGFVPFCANLTKFVTRSDMCNVFGYSFPYGLFP